jgi:RNA recognition motif-containing protein
MPDETELHQAEAACLFQAKWFSTKPTIEALNGTQLEGRTLIVNEGHPQERRAPGSTQRQGLVPFASLTGNSERLALHRHPNTK